jgi:CBS-domain-containing membrane protein
MRAGGKASAVRSRDSRRRSARWVVRWPAMARTPLDEAADLTAADVIHTRFSALPADATVTQVRDWFAASSHRKMAFLADNGRYVGSIARDDLCGDLEPTSSAAHLARSGPTIAPDAPANVGYELAVATDALRVPVVDRDRTLIGVIGVTDDLAAFCGTH